VYWENPALSGLIVGSTLLFAFLTTWGGHSVLTLAAYLCLLQLIVCATYVNGTRIWLSFQGKAPAFNAQNTEVPPIITRERLIEYLGAIADIINAFWAWIINIYRCTNNWDSFVFGVGCLGVALAGKVFSGVVIVSACIVALFTLPKYYEMNKATIDRKLGMLSGRAVEIMRGTPILSSVDSLQVKSKRQ